MELAQHNCNVRANHLGCCLLHGWMDAEGFNVPAMESRLCQFQIT